MIYRLPSRRVSAPRIVQINRAPEAANEPSCPPCTHACVEGDTCKARRVPPVLALVLVALVAAVCVAAIALGGTQ